MTLTTKHSSDYVGRHRRPEQPSRIRRVLWGIQEKTGPVGATKVKK